MYILKQLFRLFFICFLSLLCLSAIHCQSKRHEHKSPPKINSDDYFPKNEWRTSSPKEQGLDQDKLDAFIQQLDAGKLQRPISSFAIVKNSYLVVNKTFGNYDGQEPHTLQSVTKSITSTLVGVAIQQGHIQSLDQKVVDFFPEYETIEHLDNRKKAMRLEDALTMRTGQNWTGERHLDVLNSYSGDKMKYVLDYEMSDEPGKQWYYNSGIAILLGGLIHNATKMSTEDFASEHLFQPLGIESARWRWGHRGIPHTGGGLYLNPTDMARIGYLYLRNGEWDGKQILPEWWVEKATTRHVGFAESISGVSCGYGYMWWLMALDKKYQGTDKAEIFMAIGHWGQYIFVIPEYDMVVVFTNDSSASYADEIKPISLLYEYVLPAIN